MGSLSPKPMYFKFSCGGSALIPASASVSNFTLTTLNMTSTWTFTIWVVFQKNCFWLAWEKKENKWKLSNWLWYSPLCCWVTQCFQWFPKNICQKWRYNQQNAVHTFCKKRGFWWSVTRDIYSEFFEYVFRFKTSNLSACVRISSNDDKWIYFEKILTHCFI